MGRLIHFTFLFILLIGSCNVATATSVSGSTSLHATKQSSKHTATAPTSSQVSSAGSGSGTKASNGTCSTGTVNYITHTLPQQCLRTGRVPLNATVQSSSLTTPSGTGTEPTAGFTAQDGATSSSSTEGGSSESSTTSRSADAQTHSSAASQTSSTVLTAQEQDADSALDNANFLSFEEWKKQNLAKIGQSPDDVGRGQTVQPNRQRPDAANALDTLGEESEINIDFSGFGAGASIPQARAPAEGSAAQSQPSTRSGDELQSPASPVVRAKDAGKTCKERTNYASFDCAATILKSNKECKSASAVLIENKDSYMLNKCSASNKYFIVELCNDILIDTVVLANYEFFSSGFRHFRVSVSDRYPVKMEKWRDLGTYEARNTREIQAFLIENPLIWARYLRIEFLTQYGSEYYCPVSLLRVHGTTMLEEFRHQEEIARGDDEDDVDIVEPSKSQSPSAIEATASEKSSIDVDKSEAKVLSDEITGIETASSPQTMSSSSSVTPETIISEKEVRTSKDASTTSSDGMTGPTLLQSVVQSKSATVSESLDNSTKTQSEKSTGTQVPSTSETHNPPSQHVMDTANSSNASTTILASTLPEVVNLATANDSSSKAAAQTTNMKQSTAPSIDSTKPSSSVESSRTPPVQSSSTSHAAPQPSTQESFFKTVHKRLQQLESSSALSLQYIEEQSRILRDAFTKVEKRQMSTTTNFLTHLNQTVLSELQFFRQAYDQLWQSTVIELDGQRDQYQREMLALSGRLAFMADEVLWQKRMAIIQSTLLLLCLALVVFGRNSGGGFGGKDAYFEVPPLMQQVMNRSTAVLRANWETPPNSASPESRSPVSLFRRKLWRSRADDGRGSGSGSAMTEESLGKEGLDVLIQPPTPDSEYESGEDGEVEVDTEVEDASEEDIEDYPRANIVDECEIPEQALLENLHGTTQVGSHQTL